MWVVKVGHFIDVDIHHLRKFYYEHHLWKLNGSYALHGPDQTFTFYMAPTVFSVESHMLENHFWLRYIHITHKAPSIYAIQKFLVNFHFCFYKLYHLCSSTYTVYTENSWSHILLEVSWIGNQYPRRVNTMEHYYKKS